MRNTIGNLEVVKCYFSKRADGTLLCCGANTSERTYQGDYYANEFFKLPRGYNPAGLTLTQLVNNIQSNFMLAPEPGCILCGEPVAPQRPDARLCVKHLPPAAQRTLASDVAEDR